MRTEQPPIPPDHWSPERYATLAAFVPALGADVLLLLNAARAERILDLGCGDGVLTAALVASGAEVVGVDASPAMVEAARRRGIDARVTNAETLPFEAEFDAVFSNAMLHWSRDIHRVVAGVSRALKPHGRFVGEFGASGNVESIVHAARESFARRGWTFTNPWYFPTPSEFRRVLTANGLVAVDVVSFERPTPLPAGLQGWLEVFGQPIVGQAPAGAESALFAEISGRLHAVNTADYVRIRFMAVRP
jgi:trans-aconitate methyltransferase